MLYKLDNYWKDEIIKACNILNPNRIRKDDCGDFIERGEDIYIDVEALLGYIENLDYMIESIQDEFENFKEHVQTNYKQKTIEEEL